MTDNQKPDTKEVIASFNQLIRDQRNLHRVNWRPSSSSDPAVQRKDRSALNNAIRRAGGREEDDGPDDPQTFPWRSLGDRGGDT